MSDYRLRPATHLDRDTLVDHRIRMFQDMGLTFDATAMADLFGPWVTEMMAAGVYRGWVVEDGNAGIVAGGGITIIPWPPGPRYPGGRLAFVYNVYTDPSHRNHGLARRIMDTIHAWCREEGIQCLAMNASDAGRPLYESMGYSVTTSPMMFLVLE